MLGARYLEFQETSPVVQAVKEAFGNVSERNATRIGGKGGERGGGRRRGESARVSAKRDRSNFFQKSKFGKRVWLCF